MNDDPILPAEPPEYREPPKLFSRHFMTCRSFWFNHRQPEQGFGVAGIYTVIEPPEGAAFPFRVARVFVYGQFWGDDAEHRFRVRLVSIEIIEEDEVEVHLGNNGDPREFPMPGNRLAHISEVEYLNEIAFPIGPVGFEEPGLYEFQLWADGFDEPIARERVLARE